MAVVNITLSICPSFAWQSANFWQNANRRAAIIARFWSHVQRPDAKACWPFTGYIASHGYGHFQFTEDGQHYRERAHRVSWFLSRGDIPADLEVCHKCDHPRCVNPSHLYLGTQADNLRDCRLKGRPMGRQKLTEPQARAIRARALAGERQRDIARDFAVSR